MQPTHQASLRPNELQLATEPGAGRREGHPLSGKHGCPGLPRHIPVPYWLEALSWELPGVSQRVTGRETCLGLEEGAGLESPDPSDCCLSLP